MYSVDSRAAYFLPPSNDNYFVVLAANVAQRIAIPIGAKFAVFSFPDGNFGIKFGDNAVAAAIPGASGAAPNLDAYCPGQIEIKDGRDTNGAFTPPTHLSIVSAAAHSGLITFYGA